MKLSMMAFYFSTEFICWFLSAYRILWF